MSETCRVRVSGISMYPTILDGDILNVVRSGVTRYRAGDVIVYRNVFGEKICHRIIGESIFGSFITSGDNQLKIREHVYPVQVIGRAVSLERKGVTMELKSTHDSLAAMVLFLASIGRDIGYLLVNFLAGGLLRFAQRSFLARTFPNREAASAGLRTEPQKDGFRVAVVRNWKDVCGVDVREIKECEDQQGGWWMYGFHIPWAWRYSGLEDRLVRTALDEARKRGATQIHAVVASRDKFAMGLFRCISGRREPERFNARLSVFTILIAQR